MSDTSKTKTRRRRKAAARGKERKRKLEKRGTTPKFPIQPEKAAPETQAEA
jgi:hypothetical protein